MDLDDDSDGEDPNLLITEEDLDGIQSVTENLFRLRV